MGNCSHCQHALTADARFCPSCGRPHDTGGADGADGAQGRAGTLPTDPGPTAWTASDSSSADDSSVHGRFLPGYMLGTRYRIVGLLGRGGMGEVYRADDLELGQSVALKFLPEKVGSDAASLDRFRGEVRTARDIAHPNVCRVYDIAEIDGHVFLSMEYIDGDDLDHVLRRMGRPSPEKAMEIARQICLGLAAAHENGVLHRDLKPANIMLDGRGRVRITDFGLAGLADELAATPQRAGTPAYMAPEQLESGTVSVRSDVYSLGLMLFELFTGKRAFEGDKLEEVRKSRTSASLTSMTSVTDAIDPAVERVVLRCLEVDPSRRPASVYGVLGALPGGDPLAAALAAGETPSPDLVAQATETGGLRPVVALAYFLVALAMLVAAVGVAPRQRIDGYAPIEMSVAELQVRARDALEALGLDAERPHQAHGSDVNYGYLNWIQDNEKRPGRWERLAEDHPAPITFWHRFADAPLMPGNAHQTMPRPSDPAVAGPGSGIISLDFKGRLHALAFVPDDLRPAPSARPDPGPVLERAGLDPAAFVPADLAMSPSVPTSAWAWSGAIGTIAEPFVVQIGWHGTAVNYFRIVAPWDVGTAEVQGPGSGPPPGVAWVFGSVTCTLLLVTVLLARRNLRLGRSDRTGAFRVALIVTVCLWIAALPDARAGPRGGAFFFEWIWGKPLAHGLLHGAMLWVLYIALEPYARRVWPRTLVTWTRVLRGRVRDPQVGRDLLIGGILFGTLAVIGIARQSAMAAFGEPLNMPRGMPMPEVPRMAAGFLVTVAYGLTIPCLILVALMILRIVFRRPWLAVSVMVLVAIAMGALGPEHSGAGRIVAAASSALVIGVILFSVLRFGFLALVAMQCFIMLIGSAPVTLDFSKWYAMPSMLPVAACVVVLAFGFWTALAGRSLFSDELGAE